MPLISDHLLSHVRDKREGPNELNFTISDPIFILKSPVPDAKSMTDIEQILISDRTK